jgi:hypothetical protein
MATKPTKSSIVKSKVIKTTSAPKVSRARNSDTVQVAMPTRDAVAQRAYERFLERGQQHGFDVEDWLSAERDLTQRT